MPAKASKPKAADKGPFAMKGFKAKDAAAVGRTKGRTEGSPKGGSATGIGGSQR